MANNIDFARNYTNILDEVYQRSAVSHVLNSGRKMVRAGRNPCGGFTCTPEEAKAWPTTVQSHAVSKAA